MNLKMVMTYMENKVNIGQVESKIYMSYWDIRIKMRFSEYFPYKENFEIKGSLSFYTRYIGNSEKYLTFTRCRDICIFLDNSYELRDSS